jgi:hypothetical protein
MSMSDNRADNLSLVQRQFRRQAEAYSTMKVVTDPRLLGQLVATTARSGSAPRA